MSGHSQGGGHAAFIAYEKEVHRVLMFASPNDYSNFYGQPAEWLNQESVTETKDYYGFNNSLDDVVDFNDQVEIWNSLGIQEFGDFVDIDQTDYPFINTRQLIISRDTSGLASNHSMMLLDDNTPVDEFGNPEFTNVWKYMLGIDMLSSTKESSINKSLIKVYPSLASDFICFTHDEGIAFESIKLTNLISGSINTFEKVNRIELSNYPQGVYLLIAEDNIGEVYSTFLLVKR